MGKEQDAVIASKGEMMKHGTKSTIATSAKKVKPVIANKEIYKQRMEERKAQAAARRAARAAEKAKREKEAAKNAGTEPNTEKPKSAAVKKEKEASKK